MAFSNSSITKYDLPTFELPTFELLVIFSNYNKNQKV